ncbi:MAG: lipoyl synthase [Bacteroidetes bacterium GWF2_41_61]|nr:MAG: lipoyl synthase [Bacteroidetes bacterium GWF2_41_61]OFY90014.1 MAG: lipoyl synthase [Bacteroidetes bacterium RIFOXYA12_FULL_40_10]HBG24116.1 lipoyl synthase [Rikenellaceae bacterium]
MQILKDRKPEWLKIKLATGTGYSEVGKIIKEHSLNTICSSGKCPNQNECWSRGTATFMILGEICTRSCRFCATDTGRPIVIDIEEPFKLAQSVKLLGLKHCVITSVTRDDLPDQGAHHWAEVIKECRAQNPNVTIEVLIPDFSGDEALLDIVIDTKPDIIAHNIETVKRVTPNVRSKADYNTSLKVLNYISKSGIITKSGFMVGLGESENEVFEALDHLYENGCSVVTIGQYLRPTMNHIEVAEYITPNQFEKYKERALSVGFTHAESGPLVRSSYMADRAITANKT